MRRIQKQAQPMRVNETRRRAGDRHYSRRRSACPCGGVAVAILKTSDLRVCRECHVGMYPRPKGGPRKPRVFVHPDDVPRVLAGGLDSRKGADDRRG